MRLLLLYLAVFFFLCNFVSAIPNVDSVTSGTLDQGGVISIIGSGFGTKSNGPEPYRWETFEDGQAGTSLFPNNFWTNEYGGRMSQYSSFLQRHQYSTLNINHTVDHMCGLGDCPDEFSVLIDDLNVPNSKFFLSFWLRLDYVSGYTPTAWGDQGTIYPAQLKIMRLTNDLSYANPPIMLWQSYALDNERTDNSRITFDDSTGSDLSIWTIQQNINGGMPVSYEHIWFNAEAWCGNAVYPETITCEWLVMPTNGGVYQGVRWPDVSVVYDAENGPWLNSFKFGYHDAGHQEELAFNSWDDIYIDTSWARVEIGDTQNYYDCTHREMQIPQNVWDDNNIEFEVNLGSFTQADIDAGLYLFVIDENGDVSDGFPFPLSSNPAITSVSDALVHGATVSIQGSKFGVKSNGPAPFRWETWKNADIGDSAVSGSNGWWDTEYVSGSTGETTVEVSDQFLRHSRVNKHALFAFPRDQLGGAYMEKSPEEVPNQFYADFWVRWDLGEPDDVIDGTPGDGYYDQTGDDVWQVKWFRINSHDPSVRPFFAAFAFLRNYQLDYATEWQVGGFNPDTCAVQARLYDDQLNVYETILPGYDEVPTWIHYSVAVDQSDLSNAHFIVSSSYQNDHFDDFANIYHECAGLPTQMEYFKFGGSVENGGRPVDVYYSEIYLDTSWARIELCNHQDKSLATHCEIQIPSAWTSTSLSFEVNLGGFDDGSEQLYLFVVDENGMVSNGYEVDVSLDSSPHIDSVPPLSDGASVSIQGSNFGTHADYGDSLDQLNYVWMDADGIIDNTHWSSHSRAMLNQETSTQRTNSIHNAIHEDTLDIYTDSFTNILGSTISPYENGRYGMRSDFSPVDAVYVSSWVRISSDFTMSSGTDQIKLLALQNDIERSWLHIDGTPEQNSPDAWVIGSHVDGTNRDDSSGAYLSEAGEWHRLDMYGDITRDVMQFYIDGKLYRDYSYAPNSQFFSAYFTNYAREGDAGKIMTWYSDDHYIDFTQARIELCDVPAWDYSNMKHCEIQTPTSWNVDAVGFDVNLGSFTQSDVDAGLYLFAIDENGVASNGFGPLDVSFQTFSPGDLNRDGHVDLRDLSEADTLTKLLLIGRNLFS